MRYLILSVDYEIFGNGAGDVRRHIIEPAENMARTCQKHHVPLTVFFEVEEYLAFEQYAAELKKDLGYDPAALIRNQIASLLSQGHDVQLHLHPEWHGARYRDGRWFLHPEKTTVDSLFTTQTEATEYIAQRTAVIEEIGARNGVAHKVRAYRAGAFSAQPGRKLLRALAENEILVDSSVVKGLHSASAGYDYRQAPDAKSPWRISDDVAEEDDGGPLWEFPIYSVMGRRLNQLTLSRLRAKFSGNVPRSQQSRMVAQLGVKPGRPLDLLRFFWQPVPIKLDFHNLSVPQLMRWTTSAPKSANGQPDVLVLIGHTKEHVNDRHFERLLVAITSEPELNVISFGTLAQMLLHDQTCERSKQLKS